MIGFEMYYYLGKVQKSTFWGEISWVRLYFD